MRILAYNEDPDEMTHIAAFHQVRQYSLEIITCDLSIDKKGHSKCILTNQKE